MLCIYHLADHDGKGSAAIVGQKFKERIKLMKKIAQICTILLMLTTSAYATEVMHNFKVFIGPFEASHTSFSYKLTDSSYKVQSEVATYGFFNTLYPFKAKYYTDGNIKNNQLETSHYHYSSHTRFNHRTKELVYNEQGIPIYRISSKNEESKKVKLTDNPKLKIGDSYFKLCSTLKSCTSYILTWWSKEPVKILVHELSNITEVIVFWWLDKVLRVLPPANISQIFI